MKKSIFLLLASLVLLTPPAFSQSFKETMIEFKKFEAKTRSGVNRSRYIEALASIEYAVDAYKSEADDLNNENKLKFQQALDKYKSAANAWEIYNTGRLHKVPESFYKYSKTYCPKTVYLISVGYDNFDECISEIWKDASEILNTAKEVKKEDVPADKKARQKK
jgi:hypothetical protein